MGRFVAVRSVGRAVDEVSRVHELLSPLSRGDVSPLERRDVLNSIAITPLISGASGASAASDLISPPAPEAFFGGRQPLEAPPEVPPPFPFTAVRSTLPEVEDRRLFHPEAIRDVQALRTLRGSAVRFKPVGPVKGVLALPKYIGVKAEASVIMCIRRHNRRGVLLALGQGGGYHRPPRRSPTSDLWCE